MRSLRLIYFKIKSIYEDKGFNVGLYSNTIYISKTEIILGMPIDLQVACFSDPISIGVILQAMRDKI